MPTITTLIHLQRFHFPQLLFLLLIAFLSIILFLKSKRDHALKLPPTPPKLPIIGNLHQLGKLPHVSLTELSRKYGPVMLLQLGHVPTLVVSSAEAAKELFKTHDLDTCTRPKSIGPAKISYGYSDVAFSPYGDYWREIRKFFTVELLSSTKQTRSLWRAREEEVTGLIEFLSKNSTEPVELDGKIFELADGIVGTMAFGKISRSDQFGGKSCQGVVKAAIDALGSFFIEDFFPTWWGRGIDKVLGHSSRLGKSFHDLDRYYQMLLDKHRSPERSAAAHTDSEDFVDVLISLQKDPRNSLILTDLNIKALIMDTFLAGIDTSSITILWAMSELMKNPRVMKKVQSEVRSCVGEKHKVEPNDVANMNYLKMVVKETFRLHPTTPFLIPREAIRHFQIGGYDVLPGTRIFVNVRAIGRDPKSWENPEDFNPERFKGKEIDFKGQNFELLPFGSGRRICPGIGMGVGTVEFTLANLLHCFDWEMPQGMKFEEMSMEEQGGGLNVHRKEPLRLVPIKHQWKLLDIRV